MTKETECQDGCPTGTYHVAEFSHTNQYGQTIYAVVCGEYTEFYTEEVVREQASGRRAVHCPAD